MSIRNISFSTDRLARSPNCTHCGLRSATLFVSSSASAVRTSLRHSKVYALGGLESPPLEGIQTVSVAPGGAVITEFKTKVPGNYTLVDHALARLERGLVGILSVEGPPNPEIYNGQVMPGMGH